VQASNREVSNWTQPLLAPAGIGLVAFLAKQLDGVLHVLVHARVEAGYRDVVELAPTVQSAPDNYRGLPGRPRYLDEALNAPPERIRFDAIQSDEGGRLYHAQNRHLLIEVGEEFPVATPEDYTWMTLHQLTSLASRSYHLNIQARSLVACSFGLR
jgi:oxidase EvaA